MPHRPDRPAHVVKALFAVLLVRPVHARAMHAPTTPRITQKVNVVLPSPRRGRLLSACNFMQRAGSPGSARPAPQTFGAS
eukprot:2777289-Prymnesium_polylepis.2